MGETTILREMIDEDLNKMTPEIVERAAGEGDPSPGRYWTTLDTTLGWRFPTRSPRWRPMSLCWAEEC